MKLHELALTELRVGNPIVGVQVAQVSPSRARKFASVRRETHGVIEAATTPMRKFFAVLKAKEETGTVRINIQTPIGGGVFHDYDKSTGLVRLSASRQPSSKTVTMYEYGIGSIEYLGRSCMGDCNPGTYTYMFKFPQSGRKITLPNVDYDPSVGQKMSKSMKKKTWTIPDVPWMK